MLTMLFDTMSQRLAKKPAERVSWWWGIRWGDLIEISPKLSEGQPLWHRNRDENSLATLRLFELSPDELQQEIAVYWSKPLWRRWWLRFFTTIDNKIALYAYYQCCLSFRAIHQQNPQLEQRLVVYAPEQHFINKLVNALNREHIILENRLAKYVGNAVWMQKNFDGLLAEHELKRRRYFLKLRDRYLNELPTGHDRRLVKNRLEKEYQELATMLRRYFQALRQLPLSQVELAQEAAENPHRELVHVGPAVSSQHSNKLQLEEDLSCSLNSIDKWVSEKRQELEKILQAESPDYQKIQSLLVKSLHSLRCTLEPQLKEYQKIIAEACCKRVEYKVALEWSKWSEILQARFLSFFRSSALLFHPDKSYGNEIMREIRTEVFKQFRQFVDESLAALEQGIQTLQRCVPKWEIYYENLIERIEQQRREFRTWFYQKYAEVKAEHAEIRAQQAKLDAQHAEIKAQIQADHAAMRADHAAMQADHAAMEAKQATMAAEQAQMKEMLNSLISRGNRQSPPASPSQESRFFARP